MSSANLVLVVPETHKESFAKDARTELKSLDSFIQMVRETQQ